MLPEAKLLIVEGYPNAPTPYQQWETSALIQEARKLILVTKFNQNTHLSFNKMRKNLIEIKELLGNARNKQAN